MNWILIIQNLCSLGLTQAQIAREVGVRQSTIAGLLSGNQRDMRWLHGERLLVIFGRWCPELHAGAIQAFKSEETSRLADLAVESAADDLPPILTESGKVVIENLPTEGSE